MTTMLQRPRAARVPPAAALIAAVVMAAAPGLADTPDTPPGDAGAAKEAAIDHFDKGLALYDRGAWAAALAEFVEARRLYPLRNALYQAGLCLEKLEQYDEALERFESVLREVGETTPPRVKENVQRKVLEMRGLVGEITVAGAEAGATVTVDGLFRGEHPLLVPLRVAAGSHLVRVSKTGFEPFEARVVVAGGKVEQLVARLQPLGPAGRVRVAEQAGKQVEVLVDGAGVGAAPWEGPLSPGPHVVALRGEANTGTPPVQVSIEVNRTTSLTLAAEELAAALRVAPVPVNASVAVDGVSVGRGVWEGRLHAGAHRIEVSAEGFLPWVQELTVARDEQRTVRAELGRDPRSAFARRPGKLVLEATAAAAFAPFFGGEVASACGNACGNPPGVGGLALLHVGYELSFGLGFGPSVGYLAAAQSLEGRSGSIAVVGVPTPQPVTLDDSIWIHAGLVGAWVGFSVGERTPLALRLGGGALLGAASDERSGGFARASLEPTGENHPARGAYIAPELRVGIAASQRVELGVGLELLAVFMPSSPRWTPTHNVVIDEPLGVRALGNFPSETFAGPIVAIVPSLTARYDL